MNDMVHSLPFHVAARQNPARLDNDIIARHLRQTKRCKN